MPPKKKTNQKVSLDTKNVNELKKLLQEFDISDDDIRREFNKKGYVSRDDRIKKLLTLLDGAGKSYTKDNVKIPSPKKKSPSPKKGSGRGAAKKEAKVIIQKHKSYSFDKRGNLYKEGKVIARIDFANGGVKNLTESQAKKLGSLAQKKALSDGALAKLDKYVQSYTSKTVKAISQGIKVSEAVKKLFVTKKSPVTKKKKSPAKKVSPKKKKSPVKKKASPKKKKSPVKKTTTRKEMTGKEIMEALKKHSQFKGQTDYQVKKIIGEKNGKKPNEVKVADLHKVLISLMASSPSKKDHIKVKTPKKKASPKKKSPVKKASPKKKSPVKKASPKKDKLEDEIASLEEEISHLEKEISKKKKTPEKKRTSSLDKEIASLEKEVSSLEKKIVKKGKSLKLRCKNRKKCKLNFCDTKTGKCIPKGKDGAPEGFKKSKKIVFDAELGLTGTQKDIDAHRQYWEVKSSKKGGFEASFDDTSSKNNRVRTPNRTFFEEESPVKNGRCGSPDMTSFDGYDKCEPDEACDVLTGNCVKGGLKRGMWSLNIGDRVLMGTPEVIEALHKLDDFKNGTIDKNYQSPKKEKTTVQTTTKSYVPPPEKVSSADLKGKQDEIWKYFQTCLNEKMKGK